MNADLRIRTLSSEIHGGLDVLQRLESRLLDYVRDRVSDNPSPGQEPAMVVAQLLSGYYTCLETIFLRISRFFENNLPSHAWHQALLDKMVLHIDEIRPAVITPSSRNSLLELLKFRHFSRYYFELDYDWDKLRFLLKKFSEIHQPVRQELIAFDRFLLSMLEG